jgi:hypothetical protein
VAQVELWNLGVGHGTRVCTPRASRASGPITPDGTRGYLEWRPLKSK